MISKKSFISWTRTASMESAAQNNEKWIKKHRNIVRRYLVDVKFGKEIDILNLKKSSIEDFGKLHRKAKKETEDFFRTVKTIKIRRCPACSGRISDHSTDFIVAIMGGRYVRCRICTHIFLMNQPSQAVWERFYKTNDSYQADYADPRLLKRQVDEVARPKLEWLLSSYKKKYGCYPKSLLDIGAGSGHFVQAARASGLKADGIELSNRGCAFAKKNFNFDLLQIDIFKDWKYLPHYDALTLWGCLEHIVDPLSLLRISKRLAGSRRGMVLAEVPRWDSLSTSVQMMRPEKIIRHLWPLGHIHMFTDSSLATIFVAAGFKPAAAWYYGMDAYEAFLQNGLLTKKNSRPSVGKIISSMQILIDQHHASDFIAFAGAI